MRPRDRWVACSILLLAATIAVVHAADVCRITGEILDKVSGQGLGGVSVILTNMRTGVPRGVQTDARGAYVFDTVYPPGEYKITVSQPGYATVEITGIWLRINNTEVVIPPLSLESLTGPSTTTTVEGKAAVVNASDAARKLTFDERSLNALPLAGVRTFDSLAYLAPGVTQVPQSAGTGPGVGPGVGTAGQFSSNGQRGRSNNFLVDMSDNNDQDVGVRRQGYVSLVPQSIESVDQFQVISGTYQAEFGRNSGSIVNAISKTGGNAVHGSVYGYLTDNDLSARNPFDQLDGPVPGESPFRRSQYGFAIGGPFATNRSFWFGSFERQRIKDRPEEHFAVPTSSQRSYFGVSPLRNSSIPGVTELEQFFSSRGYYLPGTAGAAIWNMVPTPNNPGGPYSGNTYTEQLNGDGDGTIFSIKADHKVSEKHSFTGRYNLTDDQLTIPVTGGGIHSSIRPETRTQNLSLFVNSVFNPSMTNQARVSFGRTRLRFQEVAGSPLLFGSDNAAALKALFPGSGIIQDQLTTPIKADFGKGTYGPFGTTGALGQLFIHPFSPIGVDVYNFPQSRVNNTFQYADTFTWVKGRNTIKFGMDIRRSQQNSRLDRNVRALAEFNSGRGFDIDGSPGILRGSDLASIGYATSLFQTMIADFNGDKRADFDTTIGLRFTEYNFFIQNDIKAAPNLTLSLGFRYEVNSTPGEVNRKIETALMNPVQGIPSQSFPQGKEGDKAAYDQLVSAYSSIAAGRDMIYQADKNNWAPRIGIAWDPKGDGKAALRAGWGIFYDQNISAVTSQSRNVFPRLIPLNSSGFNFPLFGLFLLSRQWITLDAAGQSYPHQQIGTVNTIGAPPQSFGFFLGSQASEGGQGLAFTLPTQTLDTPSAQQYHVTYEREILPDTLFSAAYVGSHGIHLTRFRMPNGGIAGQSQFGISGDLVGPGGLRILTAQTRTPVTRTQAGLGPYTIFENTATSTYNSLQLQGQRRFVRGFQMTAAYSWSHVLDDVSDVFGNISFNSLPQSERDPRAERGSANFDIRHRFVSSFIWDLPWARTDAFYGGWQISGIFTGQTGQPYTVNTSFDVNNDGVLTDRLNTRAGLGYGDGGPVFLQRPAGIGANSLDTSLLAPAGSNGAEGRNTFRARGIASFDLAVFKKFRFDEMRNLEFRSEFFNLFNRTHYGVPVRILEAPGFGRAVDTALDSRRVQFALKFNF